MIWVFREFFWIEHLDDLGGTADDHTVIGYVLGHHGCRSDHRISAYAHTGQDSGTGSDPCTFRDDGRESVAELVRLFEEAYRGYGGPL